MIGLNNWYKMEEKQMIKATTDEKMLFVSIKKCNDYSPIVILSSERERKREIRS